jgi:hypothetical protein
LITPLYFRTTIRFADLALYIFAGLVTCQAGSPAERAAYRDLARSGRTLGWIIPVAIGLLIAAPITILVMTRYPKFDFLSELTVYRIGNSISVLFGETDYIRPVQGLPIAILSKFEIWVLAFFRSTYVMTAQTLALYQGIYFATLFILAIGALAFSWSTFSVAQRIAASLFFACPWILGGASNALLIEPDYWVGEWCYLSISLCALAAAKINRNGPVTAISVGAWLAVGAAMKITLLGIAPLFLLLLNDRKARTISIVGCAFAATYVVMALIYMGGVRSGFQLLAFQAQFFLHPNNQIQWPNIMDELSSQPFFIALFAASIIALAISTERPLTQLFAVAWIAGITYLLWRRPHDTSIASAATILTFIVAYFATRRAALISVVMLLLGGAALQNFDRLRWEAAVLLTGWGNTESAGLPAIQGMIFLPDNTWNASLAPQAFGYNGELGFYYPIKSGNDGKPAYAEGGKAFQALFPDTVLIAGDANSMTVAEKALKIGVPLWWTRTDPLSKGSSPADFERIEELVAKTGSTVTTYTFVGRTGAKWLLQRAVP